MLGFWCSLYQESTVVDIVSVNNISLVEVGDDTSVWQTCVIQQATLAIILYYVYTYV